MTRSQYTCHRNAPSPGPIVFVIKEMVLLTQNGKIASISCGLLLSKGLILDVGQQGSRKEGELGK